LIFPISVNVKDVKIANKQQEYVGEFLIFLGTL